VTSTAPARRNKGRAREEAVLDAAIEAIAELGLTNVRVADIAERAGIGPGHVTYYFPSKDELLVRAIRRSEEAFHAQIAEQVHRVADPWERLRTLIELAIPDGPHDPGWILWLDVMASAATNPEVAASGQELEAWWRVELRRVLHDGCDRGAFVVDDLDAAVLSLSAMIDGLSIRLTLGSNDITRDDVLRLVMAGCRGWLLVPGHS
jgi:AcrR family transcriptional regulator